MSLKSEKTPKKPFDYVRTLHTEIQEYCIDKLTKEEALAEFNSKINILKAKYGEKFVVNHEKRFGPIKDENGNIKGFEISGHFTCYIPTKNLNNQKEKNEETPRNEEER